MSASPYDLTKMLSEIRKNQPQLDIFTTLKDEARGGALNEFWNMYEVLKRKEAAREAGRIDASLAKRIFQRSEPRITISIFMGDNHGR
ncbi:MAG TPA: hypothetical protein VE732_06610 [Nitrososphaera sp.]|jgi:hypothetical protein|nr:hypothetical protein [Nitrososphaera sp.]